MLLVQVLFVLSWRLGPVLAVVIIATAGTAALYKKQTKVCNQGWCRSLPACPETKPLQHCVLIWGRFCHAQVVEKSAGQALAEMVAVADQAFHGITTVRCCSLRSSPVTDALT